LARKIVCERLHARFAGRGILFAVAAGGADRTHAFAVEIQAAHHGSIFHQTHAVGTHLVGGGVFLDDLIAVFFGAVTTNINCNWKVLLEHALVSEPAAAWQWPLLLAHAVSEAYVIEQIMPRSFLRTRLISHVYGIPGADRESALARVDANARELQRAAAFLQSQRAAGVAFTVENARVAALHEKVLAVYALQLP
jgi:hypothetical protein